MPPAGVTLAEAQRAFHSEFVPANRGRIRLIATDVDGTLTSAAGLLRSITLDTLAALRALPDPPVLVLVTGRPAAAVQGLLLYTGFAASPIVAENGAVVVARPGAPATVLAPFKAEYGETVRRYLQRAGVRTIDGPDNADRLSDMTFLPPGEPTPSALAALAAHIEAALAAVPPNVDLPRMRVLYSTVHVHVGAAEADKGGALRRLLAGTVPDLRLGPIDPATCVCLGDSGNDAAMFAAFPARAVAVPGPGPALHAGLAGLVRYAAPAVADEGFAAVIRALFPVA